MFGWFKSRWKWVATIECSFVKKNEEDVYCVYNLYVDEKGKRDCVTFGHLSYEHPFYSRKILPWLNGAGDKLLAKHLNVYSTSYWGDLSEIEETEEETPSRLEQML